MRNLEEHIFLIAMSHFIIQCQIWGNIFCLSGDEPAYEYQFFEDDL